MNVTKINQMQQTMTKRIIYRPKKPKMIITMKPESIYVPRVKSAPPISIPEAVIPEKPKEEKKHVLLKADGTPLTIDDLTDSSSEEISEKTVQFADPPAKPYIPVINELIIQPSEKPVCARCKLNEGERLKMFEDLLAEFPVKTSKSFSILEILNCKERESFKLNLMLKNKPKQPSRVTYVVDKNRKDTVIEQARLELNKLTLHNMNLVVNKLKSLNIQTIEESKEIANILIEKAVSEPTFVDVYAKAVGELRKVLKSKEEMSMDVKQTAFFGTLLTRAFAIVNEKVQWADLSEQIKIEDFPNRFAYEEKMEEIEEKRYKRKNLTFGAISFVSQLYIENIISFNKIGDRIDKLIRDPHYESVEALCALITKVGEKMQLSQKEHVIQKVFNHLNSIKSKYELRIQFLIESTIEQRKKWKRPASTPTQNRFAVLEVEEIVPEVKKEEIVAVPVDDNSKVLSFVSSIYSELEECYEEEDKKMVADSFSRGVKSFGKQKFYSFYLSEAVCDFKKSKQILPFFVEYFDRTGLDTTELVDLLKELKNNLDELKRDFPKTIPNYIELISLLKIKNLIDNGQFDELKNPEFETKAREIIIKWNKLDNFTDKVVEIFGQQLVDEALKK